MEIRHTMHTYIPTHIYPTHIQQNPWRGRGGMMKNVGGMVGIDMIFFSIFFGFFFFFFLIFFFFFFLIFFFFFFLIFFFSLFIICYLVINLTFACILSLWLLI